MIKVSHSTGTGNMGLKKTAKNNSISRAGDEMRNTVTCNTFFFLHKPSRQIWFLELEFNKSYCYSWAQAVVFGRGWHSTVKSNTPTDVWVKFHIVQWTLDSSTFFCLQSEPKFWRGSFLTTYLPTYLYFLTRKNSFMF